MTKGMKDKIKVKAMNDELMMLYLPCFLSTSTSFLSNSSPSRAFSSPPQATSELKRKLTDVKRKLEKVEVERKACGVSFTVRNNPLSIIKPFTAESTAVNGLMIDRGLFLLCPPT